MNKLEKAEDSITSVVLFELLHYDFSPDRTEKIDVSQIPLKEGEFLFSEKRYLKEIDMSSRRLRKILIWLKDNHFISFRKTNDCVIIKVDESVFSLDDFFE